MKGKTEVELYKGEAVFEKIYFREISARFANSKLNLVVYVKPSTVTYECMGILSEKVDWEDVYPLFVRNIRVLSRNKGTINDWAS